MPADSAARTMSLPSCPVAPMIATGLEDDMVLVPLDCPRRRAVGERALTQRGENLARPRLRRLTRRIPEPIRDLGETHLIRPMVRIAIPILDVGHAERMTEPFGEWTHLEVLIVR